MRKSLPNLPKMYARLNKELFAGALPSDLPVVWNHRLKRSMGRAHYRTEGRSWMSRKLIPTKIDIKVNYASERALRKTMVHEMCHVYEFIKNGKGGHNAFFWKVMADCGYPKGHTFDGDGDGEEEDIWSRSSKTFRYGDIVSFAATYRRRELKATGRITKVNSKTCRVELTKPSEYRGRVFTCSKFMLSLDEVLGTKPEPKKKKKAKPVGKKRLGGKRRAVWDVLRNNPAGVPAIAIAWEVWPGVDERKAVNNAKCYISYLRKDGYNIVLEGGKYRWEAAIRIADSCIVDAGAGEIVEVRGSSTEEAEAYRA